MAIPRLFHWIWLGPSPEPEAHVRWRQQWLELHPGWASVRWDDETLPDLVNATHMAAARSWAQRADIVRYELLHIHGGVYLDCDVEPCRPIDQLVDRHDAFCGMESDTRIGNAVLACTTGHPWMRSVIAALPDAMQTEHGTLDQTGPGLLTRVTRGRTDVAVLDRPAFYPHGPRHRGDPPAVGDGTYARHHWAGSWWEDDRALDDPLRERASAVLARHLACGEHLVIVDADLQLTVAGTVRHALVEQDGVDHGTPLDDGAALEALARQHGDGIRYLALASPAFWWFDFYTELHRVLRHRAETVHHDADVVLFRLPEDWS